jgi:hypothetical protein
MWRNRSQPMLESPEIPVPHRTEEQVMIHDTETALRLARQRERELIAEAERERQVRNAREKRGGRSPDRDGR